MGWQTRRCFHNSPPAARRLQHPSLFPPTGETAEAERSGQGSALHPSRTARPSPCKPERFSQSCALMAGMWGLARAGQAAQRLLSHGLQHRLCPLHSPAPPPHGADKDNLGLRAQAGSTPVPTTSCSPSRPCLQHMLVHSSSVKSSDPVKPLPTPPVALLGYKASLGYRHINHDGTAATEPSHAGLMFSKCFGGCPLHVPPSGHCHSHLPSPVKKSSCSTRAHVVPSRRRSHGTPGPAAQLGKNAAHHPLEPKQACGGSQT